MSNRKSFVFYHKYKDALEAMDLADVGRLLLALIEYSETRKMPDDLPPMVRMALGFIKPQMDDDIDLYEETCALRREAGASGGAPKGNQNARKNNQNKQNNQMVVSNNQNKQMVDLVVSKQPKQAKQPDYDYDYYNDSNNDSYTNNDSNNDNDSDKKSIDVESDDSTSQETAAPSPRKEEAPERTNAPKIDITPYAKIMELYNSICVSFPSIKGMGDVRKRAVAARWRAHANIRYFEEFFRAAEASSFLKGENNRNWRADFDWMMKRDNFQKIIEGRYSNGRAQTSAPGGISFARGTAKGFAALLAEEMEKEATKHDENGGL